MIGILRIAQNDGLLLARDHGCFMASDDVRVTALPTQVDFIWEDRGAQGAEPSPMSFSSSCWSLLVSIDFQKP